MARVWQRKRSRYNEQCKLAQHRKRIAILDFLGGKCQCGFSDYRALQVDHKYGGGCQEIRRYCTTARYRLIRERPELYQVLCANCNWIKRVERKEYRWQPFGGHGKMSQLDMDTLAGRLPSRQTATRWEYLFRGKWLSRQRVSQLRQRLLLP